MAHLRPRSPAGFHSQPRRGRWRNTENAVDKVIYPNLSNNEGTGLDFDFLSNGIKCRNNNGGINGSGNNYIYLAFAEEPLVANVGSSIPATAR